MQRLMQSTQTRGLSQMSSWLSWREIRYIKDAVAWQEQKVSFLELREREREKSPILPNCISLSNKMLKKKYSNW